MSMVDVYRKDYPAKVRKLRNGGEQTIPAWYSCVYKCGNKQIAYYDSRDDVLYCKTDYIGHDFSKSVYERATTCKMKDVFKYLFFMLNVDKESILSEFTDA